ncbi:MAG: NAD(P)/FAD-dependent oxidoreductase [Polyangiaceae bacterium]|nr:NAD(P)/FAD-dependent oxidoreductase [Polyangiaceae bacterium]
MTQAKELPHVVVIGGGFGGLEAAKRLADAPVRVTLLDRSNHHLFQPLLYQVAMAGLSPADIAAPIRAVLKHQQNCRVLLAEVTRVSLGSREVHLDPGDTLSYDYLVIAAGAKTNFFGNSAWARHALGLKSLDDAVEIRRRVLLSFEAAEREADPDARRRLLTFVVIGGGPTGVELAGGLAEFGRVVLAADFREIAGQSPRVILVEATDRLLPGMSDRSAERAASQLQDLGVELRLGERVTDITEHGVRLGDEWLRSSTVVWSAGVCARGLAARVGAEAGPGGRLVVEPSCTLKDHPEVLVIGDMAHFVPPGSERALPGVAPVAMQQGRYAARYITRRLAGKETPAFEYTDKGMMATIGRSRAVAESGRLRMTGFVAWIAWLFIHVLYLVGSRRRLIVLFQWTWSYFTYKRGARLITGERAWERAQLLARQAEQGPHSGSPYEVRVTDVSPTGASERAAASSHPLSAEPGEVVIHEATTTGPSA